MRFEDLHLTLDAHDNVSIVLNVNKERLASAPSYEKLDERVVEGSRGDREDKSVPRTY